jgi:Phage head-tail joining protein
MSFTDLLNFDTIVISRQTVSQDTSGGALHAPFVDKVEVAGRVESISSNQQLRFAQLEIPVTHRVFLDDVTSVKNGDIITSSDGRTFRVTGIEQRRTLGGIDNFAVILAEEVLVG